MKEKLVHVLADALEMDASKINPEDRFRDYETYSSLTELSVLAMLDSDFGIEIEMREFNKYLSVQDLVELVSQK